MKFASRKAALACGVAAAALMYGTAGWAQQRSFDVPSGDADKAIPEFARQAGIQLVAPGDQLKGVRTPPVKGVFEVHDALSMLLTGTGMTIAADDGQTIALVGKKKSDTANPIRLAADVPPPVTPSATSTAPASAAAMAATSAMAAENVLVTGSLIHGTQAVGIPVTSLNGADFKQTGAVTLGDLLRTQPAVFATPSASTTGASGNSERQTRIDVHNFGSGHTLGLFDGMRFPGQSDVGSIFDPSFIPQLAVDHIDVLAGGASATYGSDAEAGVVNVLLKRGFDGAVTEARVGEDDGGGFNWRASQLYGRTWDSGDVTITFETTGNNALPASARKELTVDFSIWGLANMTPIKSASPGIVSVGAGNVQTGTGCTNCYSIPKGTGANYSDSTTPTPPITWNQLLADQNVSNEVNPFLFSEVIPPQQSNSFVITFDQNLLPGVQFFGEGFYSNRRGEQEVPATIIPANTGTTLALGVPGTFNPYYPTGAPSNLVVNYSFAPELPPESDFYEIAARYSGGFNLDLPFDWKGKLFATENSDSSVTTVLNLVNANNASAALGNTVKATAASGTTPGIQSFTKPSNVPYLNLFCDPTAFQCNSPTTLAYISGGARLLGDHYTVQEFGSSFDGPIYPLPAGELRGAVGVDYLHYNYYTFRNNPFQATAESLSTPSTETDTRHLFAYFGQLNIPVFGDNFSFPGMKKLEIELSGRVDHYSDFGNTENPKIAVNWTPFDGLTVRGAMGTSFVAPSFANTSSITSKTIGPLNQIVGNTANGFNTCTSTAAGTTPVAGSAGAMLNDPNCTTALQNQGGILIKGGVGGLAGLTRPSNYALGPEQSHDESLGFNYSPEDNFLKGLTIDLSYWRSHITNVIVAIDDSKGKLTDPNTAFVFLTAANTPNFTSVVNTLLASPFSAGFNAGAASNITFILDGAARNAGFVIHDGVDFNIAYDWDLGSWGAWEAGIAGTYYLHDITASAPGSVPVDAETAPGSQIVNDLVVADGGETQDLRMRYRARLGVSFDHWSVTSFLNYRAHFFTTETLPSTSLLAANNIANFSNFVPSYYTVDLAISYNTGDEPANPYLKNLSLQLVVNDITNKAPPFAYKPSTAGDGQSAFWGQYDSPIQRAISVTLTKTW